MQYLRGLLSLIRFDVKEILCLSQYNVIGTTQPVFQKAVTSVSLREFFLYFR